MHLRLATPDDAPAMATIYNQGIEDRVATFETRLRTSQEIEQWFDGIHPIVILETDQQVIAFASTSVYRPRPCYAGIAEFSVYVERAWRGRGSPGIGGAHAGSGESGLLEAGVAGVCRECRQPRVAPDVGLSRGRGVREARATGWRVA